MPLPTTGSLPAGSLRIDKWIWAVRLVRTRSAAKGACVAGRVFIGGALAKPASKVVIGDVVTLKLRDRTITYHVVRLIEKRVSAALAAECFVDSSLPVERTASELPPPGGARAPGQGRPTKRERRRLDHLRGRG